MSERFWSKVRRGADEECWTWQASKRQGYGQFFENGRSHGSHRYSYILANGPIQDGLVIDHICRNRACVNPAHLRAVTRYVNVHENSEAVAHLNSLKEFCKQGHRLSGENLIAEGTRRRCKECRRLEGIAHRARNHKPIEGRIGNPVGSFNRSKTHCLNGHELSGPNLQIKPDGKRRCRVCDNIRKKAYYEQRKAMRAEPC